MNTIPHPYIDLPSVLSFWCRFYYLDFYVIRIRFDLCQIVGSPEVCVWFLLLCPIDVGLTKMKKEAIGDRFTTCFGPEGPSSSNTYIKITKERYWVMSGLYVNEIIFTINRFICDKLITRPEESYRLWCVVVCDQETS
jgi:hypothetical protein